MPAVVELELHVDGSGADENIGPKALACRVKDECRARVTVEPDERGFGIIRSIGVDVTERGMKFIFAGPAGTGEAG